jgi:hypothetical protein
MTVIELARCVQSLADAVAARSTDPVLRQQALAVRDLLWNAEKEELGRSEAQAEWRMHQNELDITSRNRSEGR